ncbi:Scr1 family TA system antitoxin-like transcriptional regulator [Actinomadura sp. 3N508]|uniref:Scr1 family TA system antitoxin-like transcriptional regulator n=1 Tax=Actinomadura sp. 3N508 TaxID=3375153 RepID=UPI0037888F9E
MSQLQPSQAAKQAFGVRLRALRLNAGLSGAELSRRTGLHPSKISRAENGRKNLPETDIRTWASACGAEEEIPELIAARRQVEQMWLEYRERLKLGQKEIQARGRSVYEQARLARVYEALHIPGILQTFNYARCQRLIWARLHGLPIDDVDEAASNRLTSQRLVFEGSTTFSFLLEATTLHTALGSLEVMGEQLDLLVQVAALPNVALGIIPLGTPRTLLGVVLLDGPG